MSKCNLECEVWSRVTGYCRPVKMWNAGKREEFKDRKSYNLDEALKKTKEGQEK